MTYALMISDRFYKSPEHRGLDVDSFVLAFHMGSWCAAHETSVVPMIAIRYELQQLPESHGEEAMSDDRIMAAIDRMLSLRLWDQHSAPESYRWNTPHFKIVQEVESRHTGVYYLWTDTTLIYVGMSASPDTRINEHRKTWPGINHVAVEWYPSRREAAAVESHAIRLFQPPGNTAGADDD